jgi:hypothetical protein
MRIAGPHRAVGHGEGIVPHEWAPSQRVVV